MPVSPVQSLNSTAAAPTVTISNLDGDRFTYPEQSGGLSQGGWRALPSGVAWEVESGREPGAATSTVTFLPDGTGSGATITTRAGVYSSIRQLEWLTGSIRHASR
jgi:hypothetical protein